MCDMINHRDVTDDSMWTVVNNPVLNIWKVAKRIGLQSFHHKKKIVTIYGDGC